MRSNWNLPRTATGRAIILGSWAVVLAAVLIGGACTSNGNPVTGQTPAPVPSFSPSAWPTLGRTVPTEVSDKGYVSGTVHGPCHLKGNSPATYRPDPRCTPGSFDPTITARQLCSPGYTTSSYRPPEDQTTAFKYNAAEPAYGMHNVKGELDHKIPLELAGSNDGTNLWVEPGTYPNPKDAVENALHAWLCQDPTQARLRAAQTAIAANWTTAEQRLGAS